jgi:hypothetical protein
MEYDFSMLTTEQLQRAIDQKIKHDLFKEELMLRKSRSRAEFKVGDKVWDVRYGWGKVIEINNKYACPVVAQFSIEGLCQSYTLGGKLMDKHPNRSLFFDVVDVQPEAMSVYETITEVSMEEIADKFGIPLDELRIKE